MSGTRGYRAAIALGGALVLGFLGVFFAWPVAAIVGLGGASGLPAVLADGGTWRLVGFTLGQAAASTALALIAGLPVAAVLARLRIPGKTVLRVLVTVPFVLPTVVVGMAFRNLFGAEAGVLPIVLANAFFNVAVVVRTVGGMWAQLDRRGQDAARALGAGRLRAFTAVTLPALAPAVASAVAVVFLFCATSFGVVLVLGGGALRTLETEIYLRTVQLLDLPGAAALSVLQIAAVLAVLVLAAVARRRREVALRLGSPVVLERRPRRDDLPVLAAGALVLAGLLVPVVGLLLRSVRGADGWTVRGYRALLGTGDGALSATGAEAALTSLRTATDATWMALLLGAVASFVLVGVRRRRTGEVLDALVMLPLGVSAVTVGFGYLVTLNLLPGDLRDSPLLVAFAQALITTPLVVRMVLPVLRAVDDRLRQAAATLGAGPWRVLREVDLPVVLRPLLGAAAFGFVVALGEFGATSFLARPEAPTLPVAIGQLISRPGELNVQMAYAACCLLLVVTALVVAVVERSRVRTGSVGEF